jgi:hypothetical protein
MTSFCLTSVLYQCNPIRVWKVEMAFVVRLCQLRYRKKLKDDEKGKDSK